MTAKDAAIRVVSDSGSDVGPGQRLREAREAAQLSVAEVASRLRLRPQVLDRLENDDYEQLHGPTFVRGYLSSYARLLDLPERPVLEAYERHGYGPPALVSELVRKPEAHVSDFPVRMVTYVIAGLLVILVVLWWQNQRLEPGARERADAAAESVQQTSRPPVTGDSAAESLPASAGSPPLEDNSVSLAPPVETAEPAAATVASEATGEGDAQQQPQAAMSDQQTTGSEALPMGAPASEDAVDEPRSEAQASTQSDGRSTAISAEPAAEAATEVVGEAAGEMISPAGGLVSTSESDGSTEGDATTTAAGVEDEAAPAPLPGSDVLAIRFARESWVEIYDRGGGRLYFSLAREGSEVVVRGAGPMRVLLGDMQGAAVAYNGAPYDLSRYQGRSLVRFTVGGLSSTTAAESPAPAAAAQEPPTPETRKPTAEENEHTVANADAAPITPGPEPATPASAPAVEVAPETALPTPALPTRAAGGTQPDS